MSPSKPKKKKRAAGDFNLYVMGGNLNARCSGCGATPEIQYKGLDPVYPVFELVCEVCGTYSPFKIYMTTKYFTPEPYRGKKLFERARLKSMRSFASDAQFDRRK